ncbi:MAG: hypothetical protein ABIN96_07975 [Rubrivivax sp.]
MSLPHPPPSRLRARRVGRAWAWIAVLVSSGCASVTAPTLQPAENAPVAAICPDGLPSGTDCWSGQDSAGAFYLIARPAEWTGTLVMHAHGGPTLGPPKRERVVADMQRWSVMVKAGYAWAGSSFHQGGVAVQAAAEDTERLRRIAVQLLGAPRHTILHGQSWGGGVAAKAAERFAAQRPYDGVLLTSGVLGGGSRSYDFRLDLRVVYQALCHNHPRADEPDYPLWMGQPADSKLTPADLAARTRECLGLGLPAASRSAEQAQRLQTLVDVIRIPERSVQGHLNWATFTFGEIAQRHGHKPVFGNIGAVYGRTPQTAWLDGAVARYAADPAAAAAFAADTDMSGRIDVPVLTVHAIDDPTAFVELESAYAQVVLKAGASAHLLQTYTGDREHSYLADPVYPAAMAVLLDWVQQGRKPTAQQLSDRCLHLQASFGPGCRFQPDYQPPPLSARVADRERP